MSNQEATMLDLTFITDGEGFRVRWAAPSIGTRESRFVAPYQGANLQLITRALEMLQDPDYPNAELKSQQRRFRTTAAEKQTLTELGLWDTTGRGRVRADAPQRIGNALYKALVADQAGAGALGSARDQATVQGLPLSLRFCLPPGAVELAALPWELLWGDPPARTPLLVKGGKIGALVRHLDIAEPLPQLSNTTKPLHVLALIPQRNQEPDLLEREAETRRQVFKPLLDTHTITLQELSPVRRGALLDIVHKQPPDIVYYYGHGDFAEGEGTLRFDDGACDIPALLVLFGGARMVTLFACEGARVDASGSLFSGIAPALSAEGVPVVLGMQVSVRVEAALRAVSKIFAALAEQHSVQEAVGRARQALFVEEQPRSSWFVPALYIRSAERGPVYLRMPPVPLSNPTATHTNQSISASGGSHISGVRQQANSGAKQSVDAHGNSTISDVVQQSALDDRQAEIDEQFERLKVQRANLALFLHRQAIMGSAYATPEIFHGLRNARAEIKRIKAILRGWGQSVYDHPDDEG